MGPGVVLASRLVGVLHGVPVNEGPGISGGNRGQYAVTLTRLSTEPVTKKVTDRWKVTAVTGRVWPVLPKDAVVPVDVGSGGVLVGGVVGIVTDVPVNAGLDTVVTVNLWTGGVLDGRETGTGMWRLGQSGSPGAEGGRRSARRPGRRGAGCCPG